MYTSKRVIRPNDEVVRYYCDTGYGLPLHAMMVLMEAKMVFMKLHF